MEPKKILIADDEKDLRDALRETLEGAGFAVLEAKDGEEAVDIAFREHPDLILLDIMMPKMNGHEALRTIRRDSWGKKAKVITLTSLDDATSVSNATFLKTNAYIIKSSESLADILKKVKQQLAGYTD